MEKHLEQSARLSGRAKVFPRSRFPPKKCLFFSPSFNYFVSKFFSGRSSDGDILLFFFGGFFGGWMITAFACSLTRFIIDLT
jgi:hypothetical protein